MIAGLFSLSESSNSATRIICENEKIQVLFIL